MSWGTCVTGFINSVITLALLLAVSLLAIQLAMASDKCLLMTWLRRLWLQTTVASRYITIVTFEFVLKEIPSLRLSLNTMRFLELNCMGVVIVVWWLACSTLDRQVGGSNLPHAGALWLSPVVQDWVNKGIGMSSRVCAARHIKDPVPQKTRVP